MDVDIVAAGALGQQVGDRAGNRFSGRLAAFIVTEEAPDFRQRDQPRAFGSGAIDQAQRRGDILVLVVLRIHLHGGDA
ncbi:MAG: hypothetical protein R2843_02890 [Thermomicrobiales bacterium]